MIAFILLVAVLGALYLFQSWKNFKLQQETKAIELAQSASAFIDPELIEQLRADEQDLSTRPYMIIKKELTEFKKQSSNIEFAYLLTLKDGKVYFLADSEPVGSDGYSPPGQEYDEATDQLKQIFSSKETLLSDPTTDRWGTWVSALVPIVNTETGELIAVLGTDYSAEYWNAEIFQYVLYQMIVVACVLLLLSAVYVVARKSASMKNLAGRLEKSESLFTRVFEQAPIGIAIVNNFIFLSEMNEEFAHILCRSREALASLNWVDITHPDDLQPDMDQFMRFKAGEIPGYSMDKRFCKPDGDYVWIHMVITSLHISNGEKMNMNHLCLIQDIHERKMAEQALRESERSKAVLLSNLPGIAYRCKYDRKWTMKFISEGCYELTGYRSESLIHNRDLSFNDIIAPPFREVLWDKWTQILSKKGRFRDEYEIITATGERKWVLEMGQGVYRNNGSVEAIEGIIIDITESKKRLDQILYINDHDSMTNLFNRRYFEAQKDRIDEEGCLPASIIMADINGVRLINDAFGHAEGDRMIIQTAKIIKSCCRMEDISARTGGDEFSILMPDVGREDAYDMLQKIKKACNDYNATIADNAQYLSLSIGYGTKDRDTESMEDAEKEAEEYMRKRKLFERKSYHSAILSSIMATMYARSQETEEHAERIANLTRLMGEKLGLSQKELDNLRLFSMLHDIGKVGIDDRIINKPGKLTEEEWVEMKRHPEIGYRIAMSAPELEGIAEYILCHHERWDGKGYPQGKQGEEIPLPSRILAVADAYDAMSEERVYRKALSIQQAIEEIRLNAGTQFDPNIAKLFIENIRQTEESH